MKPVVRNDWRELSEAASREQDPKKLMDLIERLNQALEDRANELKIQRRTALGICPATSSLWMPA